MARGAVTPSTSIRSDLVNLKLWVSSLWPRCVSWVRAALAITALGLNYLYAPQTSVLVHAVLVLLGRATFGKADLYEQDVSIAVTTFELKSK